MAVVCEGEAAMRAAAARNQHGVGLEAVTRMWKRWEHDPDSLVVPSSAASPATDSESAAPNPPPPMSGPSASAVPAAAPAVVLSAHTPAWQGAGGAAAVLAPPANPADT